MDAYLYMCGVDIKKQTVFVSYNGFSYQVELHTFCSKFGGIINIDPRFRICCNLKCWSWHLNIGSWLNTWLHRIELNLESFRFPKWYSQKCIIFISTSWRQDFPWKFPIWNFHNWRWWTVFTGNGKINGTIKPEKSTCKINFNFYHFKLCFVHTLNKTCKPGLFLTENWTDEKSSWDYLTRINSRLNKDMCGMKYISIAMHGFRFWTSEFSSAYNVFPL